MDNNKVKIKIDGKEIQVKSGQTIVEAAEEHGIYIPTLCHLKGLIPAGSCRICNVKVNGRFMTACTVKVHDGFEIENDTDEIIELRKIIIETLFVSGNHYCPACEKSGNCVLQALAYKFRIMIPRFPYAYETKEVDAESPKLILDRNRCILCKRCVRSIKNKDGKNYFAIEGRGYKARIILDKKLALSMTDEEATNAMQNCPVGCIIKKEQGFIQPVGERKFDKQEIKTIA